MSYSYTESDTEVFTKTNAGYLASKIQTDLKRIQRLYGAPSDHEIEQYYKEVVILLMHNIFKFVIYGFKKDEQYIEQTLEYTSDKLMIDCGDDDDPGKIPPWADVSGAHFTSFLEYNQKWYKLSPEEQNTIQKSFPFSRVVGQEPSFKGSFIEDLTYSSGGRSITRKILRS